MASISFGPGLGIGIPDSLPGYTNFRYRVWYTWYLIQLNLPKLARKRWFWRAMLSAADGLWFWEDEDEEFIREFIQANPPDSPCEISLVDWANACRGLESRHLERPTNSSLSHLAPLNRLRFIVWLVVAEVGRKHHLRRRGHVGELHDLIARWGSSTTYSGDESRITKCSTCGVSHFLTRWLETMLGVYLPDELESILWNDECSCFKR